MSQTDTLDVLNRLLAILYRSLPMYLYEAQLWHAPQHARAAAVLEQIVAEQRQLAQRLADFILARGGQPQPGAYPLAFTDANWHFVNLDYALRPLAEQQRVDVERIARCVADLHADREARTLAEDALGAAKAHLEQLEELAG